MAKELEKSGRESAARLAMMEPIEVEKVEKAMEAFEDGTATREQYKVLGAALWTYSPDKREKVEQGLREKNLLAGVRRREKPVLTAPISYVGENMEEFVGKYVFFDDVGVHDDLAKQGDGFNTVRVEDSRGDNYSGLPSDRSDRIVFVCSKPLADKLREFLRPFKMALNSRIICDIHPKSPDTARWYNVPPITDDEPISGVAEIYRIEIHGRGEHKYLAIIEE